MKIRFIACSFVALILLPCALLAQDDDVIKVSTGLVSIPVVVTNQDGKYVGDIGAKEFVVFDNGVRQPLEFFAATDEPITLALLIDTSHSTRPVLGDIKNAAGSLIKLLRPDDRAMIVGFDREVRVLAELTSDRSKLEKAVKEASIPEPIGTVLRDAIYQTVFEHLHGITGRKALIVLTDGGDGGSHISQIKLLLKLQESDTLIYPVQFTTERNRALAHVLRTGRVSARDAAEMSGKYKTKADLKADRAGEGLKELALVSAGRFLASDADKLKDAFQSILEELRRQYRLGFYPPETDSGPEVHEIKVGVARSGLIVRCRSSYRRPSQ